MLNHHFPNGFLVSLGHHLVFGVYINQQTFHLWGSPQVAWGRFAQP